MSHVGGVSLITLAVWVGGGLLREHCIGLAVDSDRVTLPLKNVMSFILAFNESL